MRSTLDQMNDRQKQLMDLLQEQGEVEVAYLVRRLGASEATIRRDLTGLEQLGQLTRTFGGARLREGSSLVVKTFAQKMDDMRGEKERIARCAAALVQPGMTVALDSGTTVWRVAGALKDKAPLTVVTSALAVIEELGAVDGVRINCAGGQFRRSNLDFVGSSTVSAFAGFHADLAFLGVDTLIPSRGVFADTHESAAITSAIADCSDCRVVVMEHTKIKSEGCFLGLTCERIDRVITDAGLDEATRELLESESFRLTIAAP